MLIAIHKSNGWGPKWAAYCQEKGYDYIHIDGYAGDIIGQLRQSGATHLLWHVDHANATDLLMARNVLYSAKNLGIVTFPDFDTCWYFDDKISEKYLLESIHAPMVKTWCFYRREEALSWLKTCSYPLVAKLRRGAGARNVRLIKNYGDAKKYCAKMFGRGENAFPGITSDFANRLRSAAVRGGLISKIKRLPSILRNIRKGRNEFQREKGYVYFQEYLPGNEFDIRVIVTGDRAVALKRFNRKNDFRASGSGNLTADHRQIDVRCIETAFRINDRLKSQSAAFDFIFDESKNPRVVEISYCYVSSNSNHEGYWSKDLVWHDEPVDTIGWQIENLLKR